jgi:hypothetical protein
MDIAKGLLQMLNLYCHADGAWHTDDDGNPYSSDTFVSIANAVWRTEDCVITTKQLVWTDFVMVGRVNTARLLDMCGNHG